MKKALAIVFLSIVLMFSVFLSNAFTAVPEFMACYSNNLPVIDGYLGSAEWSDAKGYKINLTGPEEIETWAYFKHNGTYMYIGLLVWQIGIHVRDQFSILFDEGNDGSYGSGTRDGVLTSNQEDLKACIASATDNDTLNDGCYKDGSFYSYNVSINFNAEGAYEYDHSTSSSEIEYWEGLTWVDDHWEIEFAIPLVGNDGAVDDVSDLVCTTSDSIGIKIQYFISGVGNYYYPAGTLYEIETYAGLSFPTPTIESCNVAGAKKDSFNLSETVYANGSGYSPSTTYDFYIVNDVETWTNGTTIPARVPDTAVNISSDTSGNILPTAVWSNPQTLGKYDIVIDVNGNGLYDVGIDALDDNDVEVTAGLVIPEFPSVLALSLFMVATLLSAVILNKNRIFRRTNREH